MVKALGGWPSTFKMPVFVIYGTEVTSLSVFKWEKKRWKRQRMWNKDFKLHVLSEDTLSSMKSRDGPIAICCVMIVTQVLPLQS